MQKRRLLRRKKINERERENRNFQKYVSKRHIDLASRLKEETWKDRILKTTIPVSRRLRVSVKTRVPCSLRQTGRKKIEAMDELTDRASGCDLTASD